MDGDIREKVAKKAYEIFKGKNGTAHSSEDDWYAAEKMILGKDSKAISGKVHNITVKKVTKKVH